MSIKIERVDYINESTFHDAASVAPRGSELTVTISLSAFQKLMLIHEWARSQYIEQ